MTGPRVVTWADYMRMIHEQARGLPREVLDDLEAMADVAEDVAPDTEESR
jgi:hypothetical protein